MAKKPKYFTIKDTDKREHRVLGGANNSKTAAGASMKSASQSNASKGGGGGGKGPSGGMMGGTGSGGSARTTPSRGADVGAGRQGGSGGSRSGPGSTGGSKTPGASKPSAPSQPKSTGPSRGPTGGPARTEPSRALGNVAPAGSKFGPRAGVDKTAGTVTPSTIAADRIIGDIARGSSVLGSTVPKMQDRVPADPTKLGGSQIVNMEQRPTITSGPPMRGGLGQISPPAKTRGLEPASGPTEDIFAGANSPFADSGVSQYDRDTYNRMSPGAAMAQGYGAYRTPPSPFSPAAQDARDRIAATSDPSGLPMPAGSALASAPMPRAVASVQPNYPSLGPVADPRTGFLAQNNVWTASPASVANLGLGAADPTGKQFTDRVASDPTRQGSPVVYNANGQTILAKEPGSVPGDFVAQRPAFVAGTDPYANQYRAVIAQGATPVTNYGPTVASYGDPYNQRYAAAARYIGALPTDRTVMPANTEQTPAEEQVSNTMTGADLMPQYSEGVRKAVEPIAKWAADKLDTRVAPSQQDSWLERVDNYLTDKFGTPGPNSPYARQQARLNDVAGRGDSGLQQPAPPPAPVAATPQPPPPPAMPQLPPYVNYQQLPTTYTGGVAPSQPITDYIYGGYADGGAITEKFGPNAGDEMAKLFKLALSIAPRGEAQMRGAEKIMQQMRERYNAPEASTPAAAPQPMPQQTVPFQPPQYQQASAQQPSPNITAFNSQQGVGDMFTAPFRSVPGMYANGGATKSRGNGDRIDAAIRLAKLFS